MGFNSDFKGLNLENWLPWLMFFRTFSSVVSQMPGWNPQRQGTAQTLPNFCVVVCIVCFVSFSVLFVCICVLYYCHRVATQLQLNISYHIKTANQVTRRLQTFIKKCLRRIMNIKWTDKITNEELWRITKQKPIEIQIEKKKMELDWTHIM